MNVQPTKNGNGNGRLRDTLTRVGAGIVLAAACAVGGAFLSIHQLEVTAATKDEVHQLELKMLRGPDWLREDIRDIKATLKEMDGRLRTHIEEHRK